MTDSSSIENHAPPTPPTVSVAEEYLQINENGRMFWRSFYNLAAMSFAINGTFTAALGFLLLSNNTRGLFEAQLMAGFICVVAVVYNLGAMTNMLFMRRRFDDLLTGFRALDLPEWIQVPNYFKKSLSPKEVLWSTRFNRAFFILLIFGYLCAFGFSTALVTGSYDLPQSASAETSATTPPPAAEQPEQQAAPQPAAAD